MRRPLDIVRWTAAVTLLRASVEKWAYPQWTDPLLAAKPQMTMGATPELFMQAAGVIEFTLAFALVRTPLVRRVAALILTGIFVSAIFEFGKVDAIGHSGIIVMLLGIAADDARTTVRARDAAWAPAYYGGALAAFLKLYYLGHEALFDTGQQFPELAKLAVIYETAPGDGACRNAYCTWIVSFIFGWMPHWMMKSPGSLRVKVACLPGS